MNINDLTIAQALAALFDSNDNNDAAPYQHLMQKNVIVRTVTMIFTGVLCAVYKNELILNRVAWIPQTDRYMQFVESGAVKECEPYPENLKVVVGRGAILDVVELSASLPRLQK